MYNTNECGFDDMKRVLSILLIFSAMFFCVQVNAWEKVDFSIDSEKVVENIIVVGDNVSVGESGYTSEQNCSTLGMLKDDIREVFKIFKIVAPVLVIIFSIYDFIKAFTGKVEGETPKAFKRFLKRLVFAMILFFLPTLIDVALGIVDPGYSTCIVD